MKYETQDYPLSGFLIASGCIMTAHKWEENKLIFEFEETDKLVKLVQSYYSLQTTINPQAYMAALKNLKNLMYQHKNDYDKPRMYNNTRNGR